MRLVATIALATACCLCAVCVVLLGIASRDDAGAEEHVASNREESRIACMHGEINGVSLTFEHGVATVGGTQYRVLNDIYEDGEHTLVKIEGNGLWIVRVDASGAIVRTYRCPRGDRTLKQIFGE